MGNPWWAWLDTRRLVLLVTMAAVFAMAARVPVDSDGWWHLASGRYIVEHNSIPQADPFSHTKAGTPWVANGWLAQVSFYLLYRHLGYAGPGLLIAAAATVALALVWAQMADNPYYERDVRIRPFYERDVRIRPFVHAFVLVLAAAVSGPVWTMRPHLATYVLTAALGWLLSLWRRGKRGALGCIPPLFVLWVNLHAGYTLGLVLLALTLAGAVLDRLCQRERAIGMAFQNGAFGSKDEERHQNGAFESKDEERHQNGAFESRDGERHRWRDIAALAAAGVLALLLVPINPYGFRMWSYPFYNAGQQVARQYIAEWASPDFHQPANQPFVLMLLLTFLLVGLSGRRGRWTDLLPVVGFAYLTLQSQRAMGLFALVTAPVLSRSVTRLLAQRWPTLLRTGCLHPPRRPPRTISPKQAFLNAMLALLLIGAALLKAGAVWREPVVEAAVRQIGFPAEATDWIVRQRPPGLLYNPYQWGGYLIWRLSPDYPVFVDGRADLYGDEFLLNYIDLAAAGPGWEKALKARGVRTALVETGGPLSGEMAASPNWEQTYEDGLAAVYVKK